MLETVLMSGVSLPRVSFITRGRDAYGDFLCDSRGLHRNACAEGDEHELLRVAAELRARQDRRLVVGHCATPHRPHRRHRVDIKLLQQKARVP